MTPAEAIDAIDFARNPMLQRRDVTGDGVPETFCNHAVKAAADKCGVLMITGLARDMLSDIDRAAWRGGPWYAVTEQIARLAANAGLFVVAGWTNPNAKQSSHIALCRPTPADAARIHIGQAGRVNFNDGPVTSGFGDLPVKFWIFSR